MAEQFGTIRNSDDSLEKKGTNGIMENIGESLKESKHKFAKVR